PRPFSKVVIGYGEPFLVKRDMDVELASLLLKDRLFELERKLADFVP
ncbi:MAG: hypothetical protein GXO44_02910, partial [Deferribacteres bacterium]|nr:hypothetical protein [Deferribacteres bacterium]